MRKVLMAVCCVAALGACSSAGSAGASATTAGATADASRLLAAEFEPAGLPTAYDIVDRFRRPWLRRDALTGSAVTVYMQDQPLGGAEALREIPAVDVQSFEFLNNEKAVLRWGSSVKGSVIVVVRKF